MTTDTHLEQLVHVETLANHLELLSPQSRGFGADLVASFRKYKKLSEAQMTWVIKLTLQAQGFSDPYWTQVSGFEGLLQFMVDAKAESPRHKLESEGDFGKLVLSLAGNKSKYPNSIGLTNGGKYGEDPVWYGYIGADGTLNLRASLPSVVSSAITNSLACLQQCTLANNSV